MGDPLLAFYIHHYYAILMKGRYQVITLSNRLHDLVWYFLRLLTVEVWVLIHLADTSTSAYKPGVKSVGTEETDWLTSEGHDYLAHMLALFDFPVLAISKASMVCVHAQTVNTINSSKQPLVILRNTSEWQLSEYALTRHVKFSARTYSTAFLVMVHSITVQMWSSKTVGLVSRTAISSKSRWGTQSLLLETNVLKGGHISDWACAKNCWRFWNGKNLGKKKWLHSLTSGVREKVTISRSDIEAACSRLYWRMVVWGWGRAWWWGTSLVCLLIINCPT